MKEYTIRGVSLAFPYNAYPSQLSMMNKIISGLVDANNCLLESPTGSGKSLALLCSCLAWQEKSRKAFLKYRESLDDSNDLSDITINGKTVKKSSRATSNGSYGKSLPKQVAVEKPPVIFYCTRTHKQIKQIISEMRKLVDCSNVKMTVLSSREHSCIYEDENGDYEGLSKNERCKKLLDSKEPGECGYYLGLQKVIRDPYKKGNSERINVENTPWDIEDLIDHGKKKRVCPYFLSRELQKTCEIIFCPYNYVIDPRIRSSMDVQLENSVVILDEAHNIEDVARSAGSLTTTQDDLNFTKEEIETILGNEKKVDPEAFQHYENVNKLILPFCSYVMGNADSLACNQFAETNKLVAGDEFINILKNQYKFTQEEFQCISSSVVALAEYEKELMNDSNSFLSTTNGALNRSTVSKKSLKLSSDSWSLIENLMLCLRFMYQTSSDFKIVLIKKYDKFRPSRIEKRQSTSAKPAGLWYSKSKRGKRETGISSVTSDFYEVQFHIWCMNPSTVFGDIAGKTRCIILASGTLSPMDSFASELGCSFPVVLEAPHVIKRSQVYVSALCQGFSSEVPIRATYQNTQTLAFQDEVGIIILEICKVIPHGVLFFLPSYKLLTLLMNRWSATGMLTKMNEVKSVFQEPQKGGSSELNRVVSQFHECIESSTTHNCGGALLIAVCRGKISEGIDFADNEARAVITLGIPYPNFKDLQVEQKRGFNDQYCASRKLLTGSDWYEIQAFRALNQALGRCIRHRNDWGAVIMLDERFVSPSTSQRYVKSLPKWIRGFMLQPQGLRDTLKSLENFVANQPAVKMEETSAIVQKHDSTATTDVEMKNHMEQKGSDSSLSPEECTSTINDANLNNNMRNYFNFNKNGANPATNGKRKNSNSNALITSTPFNVKNSKRSSNLNCDHEILKSVKESPIKPNDSSDDDIVVINESPLIENEIEIVPFKYPNSATSQEDPIFEQHERRDFVHDDSDLLFDESMDASGSKSISPIKSSSPLYCNQCKHQLETEEVSKLCKLLDSSEVMSFLLKLLKVDLYRKVFGSDQSEVYCAFESSMKSFSSHYELISSQSRDVNLNCFYDADLDVAWQYLSCPKTNKRSREVCGIIIVKQNAEIRLPSVILCVVR